MAKRPPRPKWTDDEVGLLYTDMTNQEVAKLLGRTPTAVQVKRSKIKPRLSYRPWTMKEIDIIANSPLRDKELAPILNRTVDAIRIRRSKCRRNASQNLHMS